MPSTTRRPLGARRFWPWAPLALLVLLTPVAALLTPDAAAEEGPSDIEIARQGVARAKFTLRQAIDVALKKIPGGKAVEAGLAVDDEDLAYEIEIVKGDKHQRLAVDAVSGELQEDDGEASGADDEETPEEKKLATAALKAKLSLGEAIAAAEKAVAGGKAFEAQPGWKDKALIYEIELIAGKNLVAVAIDAASGKVLAVEKE